jgi:hypothetical protein|tara:strand:- start:3187 stop:3378 length:192 start_codon:yes stop_codon:yes gene_type:complete
MKITHKQKRLIQDYLQHYYNVNIESKEAKLSLKNQIQLIYDYTTHLVDAEIEEIPRLKRPTTI